MDSMIDFWSAGRGFFPGHANNILYYFHKSITFLAGKNPKCMSLIMNGLKTLKGPVEL